MATVALMTAADLLQMPDDGLLHELVEGMLVTVPRPSFRHGQTALRIGRLLEDGAGTEAGVVTVEGGFRLRQDPDTVRGPDVGFVSAARLAAWHDDSGFSPGAPDLAVEILSPSNTAGETARKIQEYLTHGGRLVRVLDAARRTATIYRVDGSSQRLTEAGILSGEDVLPHFSMRVGALFP